MPWTTLLRTLGLVGIGLFSVVVFTPLPYSLARLTAVPPRLEPADAIVVLSGGVEPDGTLNDSSFRRAVHGIALQRRGLAPLLVFSGEASDGNSARRDARAALARDLGVPARDIFTDTGARTTREEAIRLPALLRHVGARRILLVSAPQHMARAVRLFAKAGLEVLPAPVEEPERSLALTREVMQEMLARFYYRVAGYL